MCGGNRSTGNTATAFSKRSCCSHSWLQVLVRNRQLLLLCSIGLSHKYRSVLCEI